MSLTPQDKIVKGNVIATIRDWVKAGLNAKADSSSLTAHTGATNNPHSVTASQIGLGNVGNFKAVSTVASQGLNDTEKGNARANIEATKRVSLSCTLPTSGWVDDEITISVEGVNTTDDFYVGPAPASFEEYASCGIYASALGSGEITFTRKKENGNSLSVLIDKYL